MGKQLSEVPESDGVAIGGNDVVGTLSETEGFDGAVVLTEGDLRLCHSDVPKLDSVVIAPAEEDVFIGSGEEHVFDRVVVRLR